MTLHPSNLIIFRERVATAAALVKPPAKLKLSEFADQYRYLSPETSAEPGKWYTSRFEPQREIMDTMTDPYIETLPIVASSQIGKTEMVNNLLMYHIAHDPGPIMFVHYSDKMAQKWSKFRFDPMVRDNEILRGKISDTNIKNKDSTILEKKFPGGYLMSVGANSPGPLASMPVRILFLDEVDRYPESAGEEGSPVKLAEQRTKTFDNRKIVMISSPAIKATSRIWAEYEKTDQRKWHVPCPHCGEYQEMVWDQVRWTDGDPTTTYYECISCKEPIEESQRYPMVQSGKWVATYPERINRPGYHLSELYSPFSTLEKLVETFISARKEQKEGNIEDMKVFKNTALALPWEDGVQSDLKSSQLVATRTEDYEWSDKIIFLTGAVDVQDDRLETEIIGWGPGFESWKIDYRQWYGNPAVQTLWDEVGKYLLTPIHGMRVGAAGVDTGGHYTTEAYAFCKRYQSRRFYAMKGSSTQGAPIIRNPTTNNKGKVKLFIIGTHAAKDLIFGRLALTEPGPGYMHFPRSFCDEQYFDQLISEVKVRLKTRKGIKHEYQKRTHTTRNEVLDLTVYNLAALLINPPRKIKMEKVDLKKMLTEVETEVREELKLKPPEQKQYLSPNRNNPLKQFDRRRKKWSI